MTDFDLKLPAGCRHQGNKPRGWLGIAAAAPKIVNQPVTSRSLSREEFLALTAKPPEQTIQQFKDVLEGKVRDDAAIESEYRGAHLLKMRDSAKLLTAESGFSDEAIEVWEAAIDDAVAKTVRYL